MVSFRLSLMQGQVDAFHQAIHDFVARLESQSDDFVFLKTESAGVDSHSVYEISTGEESTLELCLEHISAALELTDDTVL
ncbi:hypothetical protein E5163_04175 [Marinicauda algicola]|uniref:Uncharacterized protein n=1 Tax=Marinicauda algicola TaxID=2029849 RepID=A0A4S2H4J9_9PROT|nr:hypothetical protein [Marinicauda algicola]TGY90331.1 hypothetical protein E5163_04175 [Marinicauda algicola]